MPSTIIMPQLGETVAEGKILAWFKSVGDEIREGDNLFEVETDKVTIEVQAIVAGRLSEIRVGPGVTAKVGEVVAVVGDSPAKVSAQAGASAGKVERWRSPFEEVSSPIDGFGPAKGPNDINFTPLARRLIAQNGLDLAGVAREAERRGQRRVDGTAVRAALAARPSTSATPPFTIAPSPTPPPLPIREGDAFALNAVRQKTAERLAESWRTIPHVF